MATVLVKVEKGRIKQFEKMVAESGFAEIETTLEIKQNKSQSLASNIVRGKRKKGEKPSDVFKRIGSIKMDMEDANKLRKGWQREVK